MNEETCISCHRPKAVLNCGVCDEKTCKSCAQFLADTTFTFLPVIPEILKHTYYCPACYDQNVAPELQIYNDTLETAKGIFFFFDTQKKDPPVITRSKEVVRVDSCADRDETILRLAFLAVQMGHNCVIEAKVTSKKVRNEGHHNSTWTGTGVPATVNTAKLERYEE